MNLIQTHALTKRYGQRVAVNHFEMQVARGQIYGFVGRNGAGKSTVMKMLSGLVRPTEGEAQVFGKVVGAGQQQAHLGVLIENPGMYLHMSAYDNMMMKALCMGVIAPKEECLRLLSSVGLSEVAKLKAAKYSMGMKQRLGLALALIGSPELLLLDEPLNGLDPEGVRDIRSKIIELNEKQGVTVLISTHVLEQLEKMATCYGIIRDGHLVRQFTAAELEKECQEFIRIRTSNPALTVAHLNEKLPQALCRVMADGAIEMRGEQGTMRLAGFIKEIDVEVYELAVCACNIEDFFVELMGAESHV